MEISKAVILTMILFLYSSENCSVFAGKERYLNQVFSNTRAIYIPQVSQGHVRKIPTEIRLKMFVLLTLYYD